MPTLTERFEAKFIKADGECWVWTGAPHSAGYGLFGMDGKQPYAHRVSYELYVGPIPEGLTIDHLCANRLCVNPAHLEPVEKGENTRRGLARNIPPHCPRGHLFDEANTYRSPDGCRRCRACRRLPFRTRSDRGQRRAAEADIDICSVGGS